MSVIVRAKIRKVFLNTKFEDEECLVGALKDNGIHFTLAYNGIDVQDMETLRFVKEGSHYVVEFQAQTEVYNGQERETERGKRMVASQSARINKFINNIESSYDRLLDEKIERLKLEQYEQNMSQEVETEMKERQNTIIAKREIKRLERIKRKREMEKKKMIDEKVKKLRERAEMLGYEIEEKVENNERVMVLVRRK